MIQAANHFRNAGADTRCRGSRARKKDHFLTEGRPGIFPSDLTTNRKIETTDMKPNHNHFTPAIDCGTPLGPRLKQRHYNDLVLRPEFRDKRLVIPLGSSSIRVAPVLFGSSRGFMLGVHTLYYKGGRHAHVRTLDPEGTSVFDLAYKWLEINQPESLFSEKNRRGYKLLALPMYAFWVIIDKPAKKGAPVKSAPRLAVLDGYDASSWGGVSGLGAQIRRLIFNWDEQREGIASPLDRVEGPRLHIERIQAKGIRYPKYKIRPGRVPAPMDEELARMNAEDLDVFHPLERVIHIPSAEEEWKLLEAVVPAYLIRRIRDSLH